MLKILTRKCRPCDWNPQRWLSSAVCVYVCMYVCIRMHVWWLKSTALTEFCSMYVCMYTHVHVCMMIEIHSVDEFCSMYVCMYVYACMYVCMYVCVYAIICMLSGVWGKRSCACVCKCVCRRMYVCVYVCMYVCMYAYNRVFSLLGSLYTRIHTCICTYVRSVQMHTTSMKLFEKLLCVYTDRHIVCTSNHTPIPGIIDVFWRPLYVPVTAFLGFWKRIGASEPVSSQRFGTRFQRKKEPGGYERIKCFSPEWEYVPRYWF